MAVLEIEPEAADSKASRQLAIHHNAPMNTLQQHRQAPELYYIKATVY